MIVEEYKRELCSWLGVDKVFLYWKGRVALYALLKAAGVKEGDEVIIPAYTCVVVPNAVLYLKATPIYVDIDIESFSASVNSIKKSIGPKTKVILCQNTYGLSSNVKEIAELAVENNLVSIEDCTHGFGGEYDGEPNGSICDAAFYSTQWNKPFSTGVGGFSVVHSLSLRVELEKVNSTLASVRQAQQVMLKAQLLARRYLMTNATYWPMLRLYRWMSRKNMVIGSSESGEVESTAMPNQFFTGSSVVQASEGLRGLFDLKENLRDRLTIAKRYSELLEGLGKNRVREEYFANHSFLKYPLLVKNRNLFLAEAEREKLALGDWFTSPLHPVEGDLTPWEFDVSNYPVAKFCADHVVNLPTDSVRFNLVASFLEKNKDNVLNQEEIDQSLC